ncbi:MAG: GNAT family N-acetyltransferase [Roseivivax sp.]|nr:GNAT family N-acetyltransferase [Roseivivax sp.]MCB1344896.1 GNAT family N-acetyltransferase [Paracoccaceae bacterium]
MTAQVLAALQARAYEDMIPWSEEDFTDLLAQPSVRLFQDEHAFLLARFVADEAEILTLATEPAHRRQGRAARLIASLHRAAAQAGVATCFLEVAASNFAAQAAYAAAGYTVAGRRKAYYLQPDGTRQDALVMSRAVSAKES